MTSIISRSDAPASVSAVTSTRLADGRELLYFDDTSHPLQRPSRDRRDLPERGPSGEIRYDALTGEWVAVAAHRQHRTHLPPADECPLCPSTDARPSEIPAPDYDVAVFENRFPSLGPDLAAAPAAPGWGTRGTAGGRCEVVAFTPAAHRDVRRTQHPARAHRDRRLGAPHRGPERAARRRAGVLFENRGQDIGVTLHHPHGQIYAYPYVTPRSRGDGRGRPAVP